MTPEIVSSLAQRSQQRVAANDEFQKLGRAVERYIARKNRPAITLNEAELRKEREQDELEAEKDDPEEAAIEEALNADADKPIFPAGAYNDEVLNITLDYLQALEGRKTARN
ncbi:MAG: carboxy terminal-processing peptidase [Planctomycetaceae bacterium]